jgi:hypothetical protein
MKKDEKYIRRLIELRPMIFCLLAAIDLYGRDEAKKLAEKALQKYAEDRFVKPYKDIPMEKRWSHFQNQLIHNADDIEYSITKHDEKSVKVQYKRCIFFEIFKEHGLADFVPIYCRTDYAIGRAIHPNLNMSRTQTIADGGTFCDHNWTFEEE